MKKFFLSALIAAASAAGLAAENLIANPGFEVGTRQAGENILPGWKSRAVGGVWKYHHITDTAPHSGARCAVIKVGQDAPEKTECYFAPNRNFKLTAGKNYRLTFWAKNLAGKAVVRIVYLTLEGKYWDSKQIAIPVDAGKKEWKQYTMNIKPGKDYQLNIMAMLAGRGEFYIDDFALEEVAPAK